jgi:hypothetical protein
MTVLLLLILLQAPPMTRLGWTGLTHCPAYETCTWTGTRISQVSHHFLARTQVNAMCVLGRFCTICIADTCVWCAISHSHDCQPSSCPLHISLQEHSHPFLAPRLFAMCPSLGTPGFQVQYFRPAAAVAACSTHACAVFDHIVLPPSPGSHTAGCGFPASLHCLLRWHMVSGQNKCVVLSPRVWTSTFPACAGTLPLSWSVRTSLVHIDVSETSWAYGSNTPLSPTWPFWNALTSLRYLDMSRPAVLPNPSVYPGGVVNGKGQGGGACCLPAELC